MQQLSMQKNYLKYKIMSKRDYIEGEGVKFSKLAKPNEKLHDMEPGEFADYLRKANEEKEEGKRNDQVQS